MTSKPRWIRTRTQKKCTQCGHCCQQLPCDLAGGHNPCLALRDNEDGTYSCLLVEKNIPGVREHLLVGYGCGATIVPLKIWKRAQHMRNKP